MVLPGDQFHHGIALHPGQRLLQPAGRPFQVERVLVPHNHVQLPFQLGAPCRPFALQQVGNVVPLPALGHPRIHHASLPVPRPHRFPICAAGTEDRLEAVQLTSRPQQLFHPVKVVVPHQHPPLAPPQWPPVPFPVDVHVLSRGIQIDPLEVVKIDRVGCRAPAPAKHLGVRHLQPQGTPPPRGMPRHKPRRRGRHRPEGGIQCRDELLDQAPPHRAVVRRVGKHVMPQRAVGIKEHPHKLHPLGVLLGHGLAPLPLEVIPPKSRHAEQHRVPPVGRRVVARRQHHRPLHKTLPAMKLAQQPAGDPQQLRPLALGEFPLGDQLVQHQLNPLVGWQGIGQVGDRAVPIPRPVPHLAHQRIESRHRLHLQSRQGLLGQWLGKGDQPGRPVRRNLQRLPRPPIDHIDRHHRTGSEPVGTKPRVPPSPLLKEQVHPPAVGSRSDPLK